MTKKKWFKYLPLILLAGAIAFSPSFSVGEIAGGRAIEIRVEDILIVILGLVWITDFLISGRKKIEKPPLFLPILAWLGIGLISTLTNLIFMHLEYSRALFYFLKEIEFFFIYFYLFYHIKDIGDTKFILRFWVLATLINVGWVIYQIIKKIPPNPKWGAYGPGAIGEGGPFPSGTFFLLLFIFLVNILLYYYLNLNVSNFKKGILAIIAVSPTIGIFASSSRTTFVGFLVSLFFIFLLYFLKRKKIKAFFIGLLILIFTGTSFLFILYHSPNTERLISYFTNSSLATEWGREHRIDYWKEQLSMFPDNPLYTLIGLGKSVLLVMDDSHSQYVRNFIETGMIGSLIFLILIFSIIKRGGKSFLSQKDHLIVGLSSVLLTSTFTMLSVALFVDAFIIVRVCETYWFFTGLTMATLSLKTKENYA